MVSAALREVFNAEDLDDARERSAAVVERLAPTAPKVAALLSSRRARRSSSASSFHETVNLAAIWDLPVVFVCENNGYAEFTDSARM